MASYTSKDIKVLDEITHIRTNASMYTDVSSPTHLLEEALDNAFDECFNNHATIVAVNINTKDNVYCVIDNGRGIPYEDDVPITISTKLFSGAKFKGSKSAYQISTGLHGIGLVAVNALSTFYSVEIYGDKHAIFTFDNCKLRKKDIKQYDGERPFSTKITFKPDPKIFHDIKVDVDRIRKRLLVASVELPKVHLVLNVDDDREIIKLDKDQFFNRVVTSDNDTECSEIISLKCKDGVEEFNVMFTYSFNGSSSPRVVSSVNLLPVDNGGTHVQIFFDILKEYFSLKGKKANLKFLNSDVLAGLRAYITVDLIEPEFSGQTKDKLNNKKESLAKLTSKLEKEIDMYFTKNPKNLENLLKFFNDYRMRLDSKKHKLMNGTKRASTKMTKLRDCVSSNGELFIVEGDSAAGSLIQSRDPKIHAIFPLRGKIPNVMNAKDILKNKEIGELVQALGCGIGPHFDITKLKYGKIICAADADPDGGHISSLVTMVMVILFPEIVKSGKFYLASTPLYSINEPKEFRPLWTDEELEKARKDKRTILRAKGLGEFSPQQIKICLMDSTRHLIKIEYPENLDKVIKLFTDPNEKRKLLNEG